MQLEGIDHVPDIARFLVVPGKVDQRLSTRLLMQRNLLKPLALGLSPFGFLLSDDCCPALDTTLVFAIR
jgi:hypothetical protein